MHEFWQMCMTMMMGGGGVLMMGGMLLLAVLILAAVGLGVRSLLRQGERAPRTR